MATVMIHITAMDMDILIMDTIAIIIHGITTLTTILDITATATGTDIMTTDTIIMATPDTTGAVTITGIIQDPDLITAATITAAYQPDHHMDIAVLVFIRVL